MLPENHRKGEQHERERYRELIAARRKELGLSQEELAERLHVTDKAVSKWETGRGMPGIESLELLAEAFGAVGQRDLSGRQLTAEELPREAGDRSWRACRSERGSCRAFWPR